MRWTQVSCALQKLVVRMYRAYVLGNTSSRGNNAQSRISQRINEMVLVSSILNYLRQVRTMRATSNLLHAMDDHLLQDIGIRRDQIDALITEQQEIKNKRAAAEAEKRRKSYPTFSGRGLSHQHSGSSARLACQYENGPDFQCGVPGQFFLK